MFHVISTNISKVCFHYRLNHLVDISVFVVVRFHFSGSKRAINVSSESTSELTELFYYFSAVFIACNKTDPIKDIVFDSLTERVLTCIDYSTTRIQVCLYFSVRFIVHKWIVNTRSVRLSKTISFNGLFCCTLLYFESFVCLYRNEWTA